MRKRWLRRTTGATPCGSATWWNGAAVTLSTGLLLFRLHVLHHMQHHVMHGLQWHPVAYLQAEHMLTRQA